MAIRTGIWFFLLLAVALGCNQKDFGNGGTVCVCTKSNCDTFPSITRSAKGKFQIYTSSKAGARFQKRTGVLNSNETKLNENTTIYIDRSQKFQKIFGFGGAFTDSTGINILSLSPETQQTLLNSYFSENGIQYSMGRIPIGGTDFSTRAYTYDDVEDDFELRFFGLHMEDYTYKIPFILKALNMTNNDFLLFGSAWTAPAWMKTNDRLTGVGFLNISMHDVWADYHVKFLDAYRENGISIWGITTGNEPANGFSNFVTINDMGWIPQQQAQWITESLGPKIRTNQFYSELKIMLMDDQRVYFPWLPRFIMKNDITRAYIDGLAVHYYMDQYVPAEVLTISQEDFPEKFILATEGCEGVAAQSPVRLGSWARAENYLTSIVDDLNNWSTGWMDWNMALNLAGGPTYVGNFVDSPIIVNKTGDEFYKQPMYYALGHFSKFLRPNSVRIKSTYTGNDIKHVVFERPDGGTVVSVFNPTDNNLPLVVYDSQRKQNMVINAEKRSIISAIYW